MPADRYAPIGLSLIGLALVAGAGVWALRRRPAIPMAIACVLLAILWGRSLSAVDDVLWATPGARWELTVYRGAVRVARTERWPASGPPVHAAIHRLDDKDQARCDPYDFRGLKEIRRRVGFATASGALNGRKWTMRVIPFGWTIPLTAVGPAVATVRFARHRGLAHRRDQAGLCPACGYDLRATPGRCPECGRGPGA